MAYENPEAERFNALVWEIVRQVPEGKVTTYGFIASMIPPPRGVAANDYARLGPRWVGDAMNAVSGIDEPTVPWHRVINARGGISLPEGSKAARLQRQRLEAEGIVFGPKNTCDLKKVGWEGPDAAWLEARGLLQPQPRKKPDENSGQLPLF
ncbi:MAG: MGMT family protein [Chloroflexota bacterium]|nr:MAG: cysteine methyltransferase [Chloroflexota bacterium]